MGSNNGMEYYIAVFDIGKTNKKFLLFSEDFKSVYVDSVKIGEVYKNGILCDDIESIEAWVKEKLKEVSSKYKVTGLGMTTHGATLSYISGKRLAFPVISYNHDIEPMIRREFYKEFGSPSELYMITGTPPYGRLMTAGMQIYWFRKKYPEIYSKVDRILFFPQYLLFSVSGIETSEITSIGCHTYLYDLRRMDWSIVAEELNVDDLSPSIIDVWRGVGSFRTDSLEITTVPGIHDSNASILPFLNREGKDIVFASTGTWCVFMYPTAEFKPSPEDLYKDVVYYVNVYGKPVRSSRFAGGYEHDHYLKIISDKFNIDYREISPNVELVDEILRRCEDFITPGLIEGAGQFQKSRSRIIGSMFTKDPVAAYHILNLSLAIQSYVAVNLIVHEMSPDILIIGGFANNEIYLKLLSTLFHDSRVFRSIFPEATALGTAMCCKSAIEGVSLRELSVRLPVEEVGKLDIDLDRLMNYVEEYIEFSSR
ncbi:MAG: FGGY family carbohydrate kinase [Candidatus Caldarchaeales archaeon]